MSSKTHKMVLSIENSDRSIELTKTLVLSEEDVVNIVNFMNKLGENPIYISEILKNTEIDTKE